MIRTPSLPPRLPEPRAAETQSEFLHRCLAVADRYWQEWWAERKERAE